MSNILVTYTSFFIEGEFVDTCFFEGFLKELAAQGNNVMRVRTNELVDSSWNGSNKINSFIRKEKLIFDINQFKPDLVIAFNFSTLGGLDKILDCPFLVMEADSFLYYSDKDYLRKNHERFYFSNTTEKTLIDTKKHLGAPSNFKGMVIPFATSVVADNKINQDINIAFIGNCFSTSYKLTQKFDEYKGERNFYNLLSLEEQIMVDSASFRIGVLNELTDLGLNLYGSSNWMDLKSFFFHLAASYKKERVYSLEHNQIIYNRSKVCVNINHAQAIDGYSFRVMDIMASNGVLLSNKSNGLKDFTRGYVELPTYESSSEAREITKKLLKDDEWRKSLVLASQKCIEDKGRWIDRFEKIQNELNVKIINEVKNGKINYLDECHYYTVPKKIIDSIQLASVKFVPTICYPFIKRILCFFNIIPHRNVTFAAKKRFAKKRI